MAHHSSTLTQLITSSSYEMMKFNKLMMKFNKSMMKFNKSMMKLNL